MAGTITFCSPSYSANGPGSGMIALPVIRQFLPETIERGVRDSLAQGGVLLSRSKLIGIKVTLIDAQHHENDSNKLAFQKAARLCIRAACKEAGGALLTPLVKFELECTKGVHHIAKYVTDKNGKITKCGTDFIVGYIPVEHSFQFPEVVRSLSQGSILGCRLSLSHYEPLSQADQTRVLEDLEDSG